MSEGKLLDRIVATPSVCHGKPRIRGTRIMVWQVLDLLERGLSAADVCGADHFPDLKVEDVLACVAYANQLVLNEDVYLDEPAEVAV